MSLKIKGFIREANRDTDGFYFLHLLFHVYGSPRALTVYSRNKIHTEITDKSRFFNCRLVNFSKTNKISEIMFKLKFNRRTNKGK